MRADDRGAILVSMLVLALAGWAWPETRLMVLAALGLSSFALAFHPDPLKESPMFVKRILTGLAPYRKAIVAAAGAGLLFWLQAGSARASTAEGLRALLAALGIGAATYTVPNTQTPEG